MRSFSRFLVTAVERFGYVRIQWARGRVWRDSLDYRYRVEAPQALCEKGHLPGAFVCLACFLAMYPI